MPPGDQRGRRAAAGERGGNPAPLLDGVAAAYERDVETALASLTALVEPALVIVMGAVVLALVAAILLPLFDLTSIIK